MNTVRIICRQSRLSLLQAEIVKQKIESVLPGTAVVIIGRSSRGDRELAVPLSSLDGTDFFTEEIFGVLQNNEADIAVHSLKDMSAAHFFSHDAFAVVDREDVRDVAIINKNVIGKIRTGATIYVGTSSPRREDMAVGFLKKALPQLAAAINIETKPIRGNVESRLQQLDKGDFDITILATAGLNRLLRSKEDAPLINYLLQDKQLMFLPLIECVPAPCQGAIVAEAHPDNKEAVALLQLINDIVLFDEAYKEKQEGYIHGTGCLQRFGVTTLKTVHGSYLYAAGHNEEGKPFAQWNNLPAINRDEHNWFSSTRYMKDFFRYEWSNKIVTIEQPVVFIANYKSITGNLKNVLSAKTIWASGTRTWFELAKQGYWVQGCADALGFEWLKPSLQMPLINIAVNEICILTHAAAAMRWRQKGYHAVSNYELVAKNNIEVIAAISVVDNIFWSSFSQYQYYSHYSKATAIHGCAGGETATLLKQQGVDPLIFPTIKAFEQWRTYYTRLHSAV
jgi:hydroxymethylbilane synthase